MTGSENNRTKEELSSTILHTASQLFREHGVEAVSMHQIAKTAGVGQATLYRRYANKADLCLCMMEETLAIFRDQMAEYLSSASSQSVRNRLRGVIAIILAFLDEKSKMLGVIHAHKLSEKNSEDFFQSHPYHYLHGLITDLLLSADQSTLVRKIDAAFIAHSYIAVLSPHTYRHLVQTKGYTQELIFEQFCEMYIDSLFLTKE
ncbi:TetR/AcrR family transcriptional regulator [Paenibacillus sp. GSMTC-2017]|uniref:TetR/AcrR family transcriptional regulator n=1 Tax=Paenibacillus sp. GSMTC-2017 TaxID=2794350 RepID=UPI0018DA096D|nr:TetR/AcrR family transcriptional regulator [Paenibacillus sp. GSMTC-2017]MBH5316554.1 TetR/AcrR family transcriptional regulator [Paenibacillus sp. GSMTC-2017]